MSGGRGREFACDFLRARSGSPAPTIRTSVALPPIVGNTLDAANSVRALTAETIDVVHTLFTGARAFDTGIALILLAK